MLAGACTLRVGVPAGKCCIQSSCCRISMHCMFPGSPFRLQDWSWNKPAIDYIQLYYAALEQR